jgi:hypothetical protein
MKDKALQSVHRQMLPRLHGNRTSVSQEAAFVICLQLISRVRTGRTTTSNIDGHREEQDYPEVVRTISSVYR